MFKLPDRNERIARALTAIELGERLAHSCAQRQLELSSGRPLVVFLREQVRQEAVHASFFAGGAKLFGGATLPTGVEGAFDGYRGRIELDLSRGALAQSFVGMQLVFEALGKNVLATFDRSTSPKVSLFAAFRRRVATEEASHHAFGIRALRSEHVECGLDVQALKQSAAIYRDLARALMRECLPLFADIGANCDECLSGFEADVDQAWVAIVRR